MTPKENKEECVACGINHDQKKTLCSDQMNLSPQTPDSMDWEKELLMLVAGTRGTEPTVDNKEIVSHVKSLLTIAHSSGAEKIIKYVKDCHAKGFEMQTLVEHLENEYIVGGIE